jgi:hypothetical protein
MDNGKTAQYIPWLATAADHPLTNATYLDLEILSDNGERCSFTIFTADQVNPMGNAAVEHPVNSCVGTWLQEGAVWKGNILVMRRGQDGCFVDMRTSDGLRAKSCTIGSVSV